MVTADLPPRLARIAGLEYAINADDIMLFTKGGFIGKEEETMQAGFDTVKAILWWNPSIHQILFVKLFAS